jgi:hypothetical protein
MGFSRAFNFIGLQFEVGLPDARYLGRSPDDIVTVFQLNLHSGIRAQLNIGFLE